MEFSFMLYLHTYAKFCEILKDHTKIIYKHSLNQLSPVLDTLNYVNELTLHWLEYFLKDMRISKS